MPEEKLFTKKIAKMTGSQLVIYIPKPITEIIHAGELITVYKTNRQTHIKEEKLFTKKISKISNGKLAIYIPKSQTNIHAKELISVYKVSHSPAENTQGATIAPTPTPNISRAHLKCVEANPQFGLALNNPEMHKAKISKEKDIKEAIHEAAEKNQSILLIPKFKTISVHKNTFNQQNFSKGKYPWDTIHERDIRPTQILHDIGFETINNAIAKTKNYKLFSKPHKVDHDYDKEYLRMTPTIIIANKHLFLTKRLDEILHIY